MSCISKPTVRIVRLRGSPNSLRNDSINRKYGSLLYVARFTLKTTLKFMGAKIQKQFDIAVCYKLLIRPVEKSHILKHSNLQNHLIENRPKKPSKKAKKKFLAVKVGLTFIHNYTLLYRRKIADS